MPYKNDEPVFWDKSPSHIPAAASIFFPPGGPPPQQPIMMDESFLSVPGAEFSLYLLLILPTSSRLTILWNDDRLGGMRTNGRMSRS